MKEDTYYVGYYDEAGKEATFWVMSIDGEYVTEAPLAGGYDPNYVTRISMYDWLCDLDEQAVRDKMRILTVDELFLENV